MISCQVKDIGLRYRGDDIGKIQDAREYCLGLKALLGSLRFISEMPRAVRQLRSRRIAPDVFRLQMRLAVHSVTVLVGGFLAVYVHAFPGDHVRGHKRLQCGLMVANKDNMADSTCKFQEVQEYCILWQVMDFSKTPASPNVRKNLSYFCSKISLSSWRDKSDT